jgi:hypothetical protein
MHTAIRSRFTNRPCGTRSKASMRRAELVQMMRNLGIKRSYTNASQTVLGKDGKTRAKRVVKKVAQMCNNISKAINAKPANTSVNGYKPLYKIFKTPRAAPARNARVARAAMKLRHNANKKINADPNRPLYQMFSNNSKPAANNKPVETMAKNNMINTAKNVIKTVVNNAKRNYKAAPRRSSRLAARR